MVQPTVEHEIKPIHTAIEGALPGGFTLRDPIGVEVWREDEDYVAAAPDLLIHAFGESIDEAMANLRQEVVDQLRRLEEMSDRLAPRMAAQLDLLRRLVISGHA